MMREEFYQSQYGDPVNNYEIKAGCSGGGGAESAESAEHYEDGNQGIVESMDITGAPDESFLWSEERSSSFIEDRNIRRIPPSCCIEPLHIAIDLTNGTQNEILLWSITIDEDREDDVARYRHCRRPERMTGWFLFRDRVTSALRRDVSREILQWSDQQRWTACVILTPL